MSGDPQQPTPPSNLSLGVRLDRAEAEFLAQWKASTPDARPRIEDFLGDVPESERWTMLQELLKLEWELRQAEQDNPPAEEYCERFPEHSELITREFRKTIRHPAMPKQLGDYEILEPLGRGGMGVVYKARHVRLGKTVALKVLRGQTVEDAQARSRFEREMELIGRLDHPNIVHALDAREESDTFLLVMEYVEGIDLEEVVKTLRPLPLGPACEVIRQAAIGLQHAHEHGLVHRDIKPSNLMLTIGSDSGPSTAGRVKILDLGLGRLHNEHHEAPSPQLTQPGLVMGTADYMAPEQWDDSHSVDVRADIYSLGCTFFFLLSGKAPYSGASFTTIRKKFEGHLMAPVPSIRATRGDLPADVETLLRRMLAKEPDQRFATPQEVADSIAPLADATALGDLATAARRARMENLGRATTDVLLASSVSDTDRSRPPRSGDQATPLTLPAQVRQWYLRRPWQAALATLVILAVATALASIYYVSPTAETNADLAATPSLSGEWWFHETPQFVPAVRRQLIASINYGETELAGVDLAVLDQKAKAGDVKSLLDSLGEVREFLSGELSEDEQKLLFSLRGADREHTDPEQYQAELASIAGRFDTTDETTPSQSHLLAILHHELADYDAARQLYEAALSGFEETEQDELYALCASDYVELLSNARLEGDPFFYLSKAREKSNAPLLHVFTYCQEALLHQRRGNWQQAETMLKQADSVEGLDPKHPLKSYVARRRGLIQLAAWQFSDARLSFQQSNDILVEQLGRNPFALQGIFWALQGEAMADHFLGLQDNALANFRSLLDKIDSAVAGRHPYLSKLGVSRRQVRESRARRPNIYELIADCYLFGSQMDAEKAADALQSALDEAVANGLDRDERSPHVARLRYKRLIALLLAGRRDEVVGPAGGAGGLIAEAVAQEGTLTVADGRETLVPFNPNQEPIFRLAKQIAEGLIQLTTEDAAVLQQQGADALIAAASLASDEKLKREELGLRLLALEQVAKSPAGKQADDLRTITAELVDIDAQVTVGGDANVRNYLRRFVESVRDALVDVPDPGLNEARAEVKELLNR